MRAGGLKYEIEIQHSVDHSNSFGESEKKWETLTITRADIRWINGARIKDSHEMTTSYKVEFRIRRYHKVDENMRILYDKKKYRIEAIIPNDNKSMLTLVTEKINE